MLRLSFFPRASLAVGVILCIGCQARVAPSKAPPGVSVAKPAGPSRSGQEPAGTALASPAAAAGPSAHADAPLRISPAEFTITADDAGLQLLLGRDDDGSTRDLTALAAWTAEPPGFVQIDSNGYLRPATAGNKNVLVTVHAAVDGQTAAGAVTLEARGRRSWDFGQDIVPILTRSGCNTGNCHGRADGQNGFHLSLFGYDPAGDYVALTRDGGQRRLSRFAPEESLFLAKATGRLAHGGGARFLVRSPEYETVLAWLRDGAPERA